MFRVQFFFPGALVVPSVGWTLPTVEPSSAASYRAVRSAVARMQYGYMDQQQNYQQSYGGVQWRIDASYGVQAMPQFRFPALPKYWALPYTVRNGEDQVLSRWNMMNEALTVSRVQCMVRVLADGTPTLVGCGKAPSLYRAFGGPWSPLYKGESVLLSDGLQVSLDCNNPEGAVFTCFDESGGRQGGYDQQGYTQQGGYQGWTSAVDPASGQTYYVNDETGQSQWDPPW
ncbi:hypothetical protein EMIHUDRAFT_224425 [Emiliania huxleyi CCMP1516]|uniref:WW domain-containing protein n=2 Tax=Emiliania huxleyi TaxID=2903 RepID=A0A0D3KS99_EMIH1|nr:hypothetical protein EMIHUDRAFT_224425 [Emiliania huxleyi CCMP1516]EOD38634.1 hypothetical protein EMIHUDRAFT_224425 [Emiliania huxleyi CCMP1516]|eukprot:XP_005791063.1 hypothetical protein EMIHUDRAFT_224425 [Emiliania huxleyi CCMP1516]